MLVYNQAIINQMIIISYRDFVPWSYRSKSDRLLHIFRVKLDVKRTFLASWLKERGIRTRHFFLLVAA